MSNQSNINGAYAVTVTVGNVGIPGAPVAEIALVVVPSQHKVSGRVHVSQAVEGGDYTGEVQGTIYSTGLGKVTQIVGLKGVITPASGEMPIEVPFEANLAIDNAWSGTGGFHYLNVHVHDVPVAKVQ